MHATAGRLSGCSAGSFYALSVGLLIARDAGSGEQGHSENGFYALSVGLLIARGIGMVFWVAGTRFYALSVGLLIARVASAP